MRLTLCEAPTRETRPDHYTGNSVPYSLRQVRGFFNVPCWPYNTEDAGDRAYDLSSLSEKTRTSNHLQMSLQKQHVLLSYFKTLSVGPVWGLNPRLPAQQSGALPTELPVGGFINETFICWLHLLPWLFSFDHRMFTNDRSEWLYNSSRVEWKSVNYTTAVGANQRYERVLSCQLKNVYWRKVWMKRLPTI